MNYFSVFVQFLFGIVFSKAFPPWFQRFSTKFPTACAKLTIVVTHHLGSKWEKKRFFSYIYGSNGGFGGVFHSFSGFPQDNGGKVFHRGKFHGDAWNGDSRGERYSRISRKMGSLVAAMAFTAPRRALGFAFPKSIWMQAENTEAFCEKLLLGSET